MTRPSKKFIIPSLLLILILVFACYGQVLFFDYLNWDDPVHFLDNPYIVSLSLDNLANIFRTTVNDIYIPLTVLSHAIEYHFFSLNPMLYHFHNVLLHIGVTVFIFFFSRQCGLTWNASLIASLIFGVHPLHVESVAWVTERKDVLYAFFYMAALYSYGLYLKHKTFFLYGGSLFCGLLSILAKPMALSLPIVLFICDWIHGRKFSLQSLIDKVPFFLYSMAIAWITFALNARAPGDGVFNGILIWIWTFSFYIFKFILPVHLVPVYALPTPVTISNPAYSYSILFVGTLAVLLWQWRRQRWFYLHSYYMWRRSSLYYVLMTMQICTLLPIVLCICRVLVFVFSLDIYLISC